MNNILISILLGCFGLIIGYVIAVVINNLKVNKAEKKAEDLINKANKEIEKSKRDAAIQLKEDQHKAKMELDKEIREKKAEAKAAEDRLMQRESNERPGEDAGGE